jgi:hypothetical protein
MVDLQAVKCSYLTWVMQLDKFYLFERRKGGMRPEYRPLFLQPPRQVRRANIGGC